MAQLRLDLHVHSRHSPDSSLSIETIVTHLGACGLNGFALTDHNTVVGHAELAAWQSKFPDLVLVPGIEVSTAEGHLLAYGISEVPVLRRPVAETIDWVRKHGGVSVLAHPFRLSHGVGGKVAERASADAIEVVNGHNSPRANRRAERLAARRSLGRTGGSDVHELSDLGRAYTEFAEGSPSVETVLSELRRGATIAGGSALPLAGRMRTELRTVALRLRRGFRPI